MKKQITVMIDDGTVEVIDTLSRAMKISRSNCVQVICSTGLRHLPKLWSDKLTEQRIKDRKDG